MIITKKEWVEHDQITAFRFCFGWLLIPLLILSHVLLKETFLGAMGAVG